MELANVVDQAKRLDEIGFPEFTAKLVGDTFDALVMANLKQVESYVGMVEQVSKSLSKYVNGTKDDITGAEILGYLEAVIPAVAADSEHDSKIYEGATLDEPTADVLNAVVEVPAEVVSPSPTFASGTELTGSVWADVLDAVATRISVNKYTLLQEMVKQGILRLVVENGKIETRLTFTSYGSFAYNRDATTYQRDTTNKRSRAGAGFIFAPIFSAKERTNSTRLSVRTTKESQRDITGSRVEIFGGVVINFKTDYQPLS